MHENESYLLFTLVLPSDPRDHHNKSMKNGFINLLKITRLPFSAKRLLCDMCACGREKLQKICFDTQS